ncbi:MAG: hypothetical protein NXH85_11100 [Pseudomonadaceae bacterium]|nr:hypothetical protein [Pseudomonadaceae bacterium]
MSQAEDHTEAAPPDTSGGLNFATVQLTFLSIVVALILENALGELSVRDMLWQPGTEALVLWLQVLTVGFATIATWAGFAISLSFGRPATSSDFVLPVLLLVCLYSAGTTFFPVPVQYWMLALAAASSVAGCMLWKDIRFAQLGGFIGPRNAFRSQLALVALYLSGALVMTIGWNAALPWLVVGVGIEAIGLYSALSAWNNRRLPGAEAEQA